MGIGKRLAECDGNEREMDWLTARRNHLIQLNRGAP